MPSSAQEGERDALTMRQQDRCHVYSDEKSNKTRGNSHGFALSRTLSCERARNSLAANGDAECANVAAGVKSPQRDGVFAGSKAAEVD